MISKLKKNQGFVKYFKNTSWLFIEKIFRIASGLLITIWLAKYLGPEEFGTLNYVLSFVALFGILASLGLDKLVTKELLLNPQDGDFAMGTSFLLRIVGTIILVPLATFSITLVRPDSELIFTMVIIISSALFFNAFEVIKYWFESHLQAKYSATVEFIVVLSILCIKVLLILSKAPLIAFAWVVLAESILLAIGLIIVYLNQLNKISNWRASVKKVKYLLKESYPLILTGAIYILFTRIDQLMLGSMINDTAVGIYAVAIKISEGWMFIPGIIATSFFPAMLNARKNNYNLYLQRTQNLLNLMVFLGVVVGIVVFFMASPFINLIFGESYSESSLVLVIHIWGMLFNAVSIISFRYFLAEDLQIYSFYRALIGLVLNIVLNYLLIPLYGVVGAAISTVISQMVAVWLLNSISSKTRVMFFMQNKALSFYWVILILKYTRIKK